MGDPNHMHRPTNNCKNKITCCEKKNEKKKKKEKTKENTIAKSRD
jgi:hypothetical protein